MKSSIKITFCAVVSALIAVVMSASLVPNITFAVPAIAGLFIISVFAEIGAVWAFGTFFVSAILSFFIADKTSFILFVCFFGFYPVLKPLIERTKSRITEWILKFFVFNLSAFCLYIIEILLFDFKLKLWPLTAIWLAGNVAFILYDVAVSRIALFYYARIHSAVSKILR